MTIQVTRKIEIPDEILRKAISIRFCRHFPAMNVARDVARALGGCQSLDWEILEQFKPQELLDEAKERDLDISDLEVAMGSCDCCPRLVIESGLYDRLQTKPK